MTEHKWIRPRNWNDGPMSAPKRPEPARCEECGVVVYDTSLFKLKEGPCPETTSHQWTSSGADGFYCYCGGWADKTPQNYGKPELSRLPCSRNFEHKYPFKGLPGRAGEMIPTVIVDVRTVPSTSIERQALLDIKYLYTNTDEDSDNEDFIRAIWDIVKGVV